MDIATIKNKLVFLSTLAETRATQENDGNASPVFWVIQSQVKESVPLEYADSYELEFSSESIGVSDTYDDSRLDELKDVIKTDILDRLDDDETRQELLDSIDEADDIDDIYNELVDIVFSGIDDYKCKLHGIRHVYRTVTDHVFFTKADAKRHIQKCSYRYNNPRTYANTALDSEEARCIFSLLGDTELWTALLDMLADKETN